MGESGMNIHISSDNAKMGEVPSFSLPPVVTCRKGVPCAGKCYARRFWPIILKRYSENYEVSKNLIRFENLMNAWLTLNSPAVFRIHVSGDYYSARYLKTWIRIARRFPGTRFFSFSKQWDVIRAAVTRPANLPKNFTIILSAWLPVGDKSVWLPPKDLHDGFATAYVIDQKKRSEQMVAIEEAIGTRRLLRTQECTGNCDTCGLCFHRRKKDGDILFSLH